MIRGGSLGDIAVVDKTGVDNKSGLTARKQAAEAPEPNWHSVWQRFLHFVREG